MALSGKINKASCSKSDCSQHLSKERQIQDAHKKAPNIYHNYEDDYGHKNLPGRRHGACYVFNHLATAVW